MKEKNINNIPAENINIQLDNTQFFDAFNNYLLKRGHKHSTIQAYLKSAKHFLFWLKEKYPYKEDITIEKVQEFIEKHLPTCCCSPIFPKYPIKIRASLNKILLMQGDKRFRNVKDKALPEIEEAIIRFDEYLNNVCGLAEATRWYHRRHIRMLLEWMFATPPLIFNKISPGELCRFITEVADKYKPSSIGVLTYSLSIYNKFLQFSGYNIFPLKGNIPRPANWSAASLPKSLTSKQLMHFFSVFDCSTSIGKRDYAMARCLADLGLRCYEVANIKLDSINWHSRILNLPKTKNRRSENLPIPTTLLLALIDYLRYGRPKTDDRAIFVFHNAPRGKGVERTTVRGAVRRAFCRADLPWSGTHILRNTLATHLLESGATLKEIADVLRHSSIDTTKIYIKVDILNLKRVIMPWTGGE